MKEPEVFNPPSNEVLISVLQRDFKAMWPVFSVLEGNEEFLLLREEVHFGVDYEFNIEKVVQGHIEDYPFANKFKVKGYKKMNWDSFWIEMRKREAIMRDILQSLIKDVLPQYEEYQD